MAKKFGKVLLLTAALGAVAGGAYYYLKGKDAFLDDDFDDDDFDNFDEDLDEGDSDRNYVNLDLNKAETPEEALKGTGDQSDAAINGKDGKVDFKEGIQAAKAEATDKIVGGAKKVEEFFDDEDDEYTAG